MTQTPHHRSMPLRLSPRAAAALVCPACRTPVAGADPGLACATCGERYPVTDGQADLRPRRTIRVDVPFEVGVDREVEGLDRVRRLERREGSTHDPSVIAWTFDETHGARMTPELFTHVPDLPPDGGVLLDLGCGETAVYAPLLRSTGFDYVGLDVAGTTPDVLADAHRLPFRDGSVDAVVAISVLEHLRVPAVAMREIHRVLRPGGVLVGSVALVEPFHMDSYLHHTHLGTLAALTDAGFEVDVVAPTDDWSGLQAYAEMALFPGFWRTSWLVAAPIVRVVRALSWMWWRVVGSVGRLDRDRRHRQLLLASGFRYVARRPPTAGATG